MFTVAVVVALAVVLGRFAGGRLSRLGELPLRGAGLALAAVAAQVLGVLGGVVGLPAGPLWAAGLVVSALCVLGFVAVNRAVPGSGLVAAGLLLNALVVGANAAMPVSLHAAARAGVPAAEAVGGPRHEAAGAGSRLRLLGDVVPVPLPVRPEVLSPGDLLVAAGLAQLVVAGMLGPARRARGPRPAQARDTTRASASTT